MQTKSKVMHFVQDVFWTATFCSFSDIFATKINLDPLLVVVDHLWILLAWRKHYTIYRLLTSFFRKKKESPKFNSCTQY